ncbi:MAG TPA: aminoglycoside phosphotransferase family protein [Bryobacteraceae bacterium]|nr:aminoglycoside phosphotransferase family protein [Bryobacteraceae bacterium]
MGPAAFGIYRRCWRAGARRRWRRLGTGPIRVGERRAAVAAGSREAIAQRQLLATDLHAGNVLRAEREAWLAIDPKPFIGDVAYDVVQHLHVCEARLHADPIGMVKRLADLVEVDEERLRLWTFARAAADPRAAWDNPVWMDIARSLG